MSFLFLVLLAVVSVVVGTAGTGDSTAVFNGSTLTTTITSIYTSTLPISSHGLTFSPVRNSSFTAGPGRNSTRHCNNSVATVTSWMTHDVPTPFFIFKTVTVYVSRHEPRPQTTSVDTLSLSISAALSSSHDCDNATTSATTSARTTSLFGFSSVNGTIPSGTTHPIFNTTHLPIGNVSVFARSGRILHVRPLPPATAINVTTALNNSTTGVGIGETTAATILTSSTTSETSDTATATTTVIFTITAATTTSVEVGGTAGNETTGSTLSSDVTIETTSGTSSSDTSIATTTLMNDTAASTLSQVSTTTSFVANLSSSSTVSSALSVLSFNTSINDVSTSAFISTNTSSIMLHTPTPVYINISTFIASGMHLSSNVSATLITTTDTLTSLSSDNSSPIVLPTSTAVSSKHPTHHAASTLTMTATTIPASTITTATGAACAIRPPRIFMHLARVVAFLDVIKVHASVVTCGDGTGLCESIMTTISTTSTISSTITVHATITSVTTINTTVVIPASGLVGNSSSSRCSSNGTTVSIDTMMTPHNSSVSHSATPGVHSHGPDPTTAATSSVHATASAFANHLAISTVGSLMLVGAGAWCIL